MKIGTLPLATSTTTVGRALDLMRERKVSGIAVPREHTISLVGYGDLIVGDFDPRTRVTSIEPMRLAQRLTVKEAKRFKITRTHRVPSAALRALEEFMTTRGYFYAGFGGSQDELSIASLYELGMEPYLVQPKSCYCTNRFTPHPYENGAHGKICRRDGSRIVCT